MKLRSCKTKPTRYVQNTRNADNKVLPNSEGDRELCPVFGCNSSELVQFYWRVTTNRWIDLLYKHHWRELWNPGCHYLNYKDCDLKVDNCVILICWMLTFLGLASSQCWYQNRSSGTKASLGQKLWPRLNGKIQIISS